MKFNERLRELRKESGFTAQNMADQLELSLRAYQFYESGKREPPLQTLVKIADILIVSTDYLLCRDDWIDSVEEFFGEHLINLQGNPKE